MFIGCMYLWLTFLYVELFNDDQVANKILQSEDPKIQKELGRRVRNFDPSIWTDHCDDIVKLANYIKVCMCKCQDRNCNNTVDIKKA